MFAEFNTSRKSIFNSHTCSQMGSALDEVIWLHITKITFFISIYFINIKVVPTKINITTRR